MSRLDVGKKTIELLKNPDYSEWDDEELIRGQQKDKRGRFNGRLPKVIPIGLLQELNKRNASHATKKLLELVLPAVEYLGQVVKGEVEPDPDRIRVCETLLNRVLGKQAERVVVMESEENKYEAAGVRKAIVIRNAIDVESTEEDEEDPFGD